MSKHATPDHKQKMNKRFVAGGVAAALGLGLFAATPVVAQEAPSAEQAPSGDAPDRPRLERLAERRTALAGALGIDVADLRTARREVLSDELGGAVAEGRLTQEGADEMLRAFDDGTLHELLRERREARLEERLAEAVDQGRITQEEADEMLKAIDNGTLREYFEARRQAGERPGGGARPSERAGGD